MAIKFEDIIRNLVSDEVPITRGIVRRLSNLGEPERQALIKAWGSIPVKRRYQVLREIATLSETDFDTDFSAVTHLALTDLHDNLREAAIEASWTDESVEMLNRLLPMATIDLRQLCALPLSARLDASFCRLSLASSVRCKRGKLSASR
jgi:hypothetical protein